MRLPCRTALILGLAIGLVSVACNDTFRPIANPIPIPGGDPNSFDIVSVLTQNPSGAKDYITYIDVSGDTNAGNRQVGPGAVYSSWDFAKGQVLTANSNDTVTASSYSSVSIPTATLLPGSDPVFIGTKKTGSAYVLNSGQISPDCPSSPSVGVLATATVSLVQNICLQDGSGAASDPVFLAQTPDTRKLVVLDRTLNQVFIVNLGSSIVEARVNVGTAPVWAIITSDSKYAYILNRGSNDISIVDLTNNTVAGATVPTGGTTPVSMTADPRLNRLYVANRGSNTVSVFDLSNPTSPNSLHTPITVGPAPTRVAVLGDGSAAFVANTGANYISRIDAASFIRNDIVVSSAPGAAVVDIDTPISAPRVFAAVVDPTDTSNGTAIVRTTDNVLVTTIPAPQQDLSCVPAAGPPVVTCPLARPFQIQSRK